MKKRAVLNFAASTVYQILNLLVGLIVPKFYTEAFGSAYNGLNQSVSQIMSLLSVLQFGISAASIQMMFRYIAENDEKMISAVYWDTGRQYRLMGYAFVALIIPIAVVFPYAIQSDGVSYYVIVAFLLFRAISSAMEYFFQAKYGVIMVAHNLSYVVYCINSVLLLLGTALHLLVIFTGRNILVYQAVALVTTLVRLVIVSGYVRKKFPYLHHYKRQKGLTEKGSKRKDVMVSEIAGMVIDSTDLLVLSAFSGLVAASVYSVYNFVTAGLGNVLGSCREAVFAGIGRTYYADREAFKRKISEFESIYFFLAFYLYSTTMVLFEPFVRTYTAKMDAEYVYAGFPLLFILARLLVNMRIPSIVAINTAGHFREVKYYAVMEAVINLVLSVLLVKPLGIYGVLIGTITGAAVRTPILVHYANRHIICRTDWKYWKKILLWAPLFFGCCLIGSAGWITCETLMQWIAAAAIVAAVLMVISLLWLRLIERDVYKALIETVRRFLKRGRV